jgi:hypothetical protein
MWLSRGGCLGKWSVLVNNGAQKDVSAPSGPGLCAFVHLSGSILRKTPFIYRKRSFYQDRLGTNIGKTQKQTAFSTFPMFCPEPVLANGMVFVFMKTWRGFKANKELSVLFSLRPHQPAAQPKPRPPDASKENASLFFKVPFLCLSRACLGKKLVLYVNGAKDAFSAPLSKRRLGRVLLCKKRTNSRFLWNLPYVCPEPVLECARV